MLRKEEVEINNLYFERYISYEQIQARVQALATVLNDRATQGTTLLLPVLTGAYRFAAELLPLLHFPYEISFVKCASYGHSTQSAGTITMELAPLSDLTGKHIIILEDIVDTGLTLDFLVQTMRQSNAASIFVATLLFKPPNHHGTIQPDWVGFDVGSEFVVGFGMDFAQQGRYLKDVYRQTPRL